MPIKLDAAKVQRLQDKMTAAHLADRITYCGCSKQTLRICWDCETVVCGCRPDCYCDKLKD